jgi:hypothetical protein
MLSTTSILIWGEMVVFSGSVLFCKSGKSQPGSLNRSYLVFSAGGGRLLGQRATLLLPSSSLLRPPPRPRATLRSRVVHRPGPPRQSHKRFSPTPIRRPPGEDATANRYDHLPMVGMRIKNPSPDTPRAPPNPRLPRRTPQA